MLSPRTSWKLKRFFTGLFFLVCGAFGWFLVILSLIHGRFGDTNSTEHPTAFWITLSIAMIIGTGAIIAGILWLRRRKLRKGNWGPIHF